MTQTTVIVPNDLMVYKPTRETYALSWRINPDVGESLGNFDCEIQMDTVDTFDSLNLRHFVKTSQQILNYQDGYFFKAFIFKYMETFTELTFYYRVRVNSLDYISEWSNSLSFILDKVTWYEDMQMLYGLVPDDNVYAKEGITQTLKIIEMWAREIQDFKKEIDRVREGINFYKLQDSSLYDTLGKLLEYERTELRPVIEYKKELLELWNAFLYGGTEGGLKRFIKAILGMDPTFEYVRDRYGWIIRDTQDPSVPYDGSYELPENPYTDSTNYYRLRDDSLLPVVLSPVPQPNSRISKGLSLNLTVYNPFNLITRHALIESFVSKIKPVNVTIYISYVAPESSTRFWGSGSWGGGQYWGQRETLWRPYVPTD